MEKLGEFELNRIYCMDCLEGLKKIPDNSVDLVITSPPYCSMRNYNGMKEQFGYFTTKEEYISNLTKIFLEIPRLLTDKGAFVLNIDDVFDKEWSMVIHKLINNIMDKLILQEKMIWIKKNPQPYLSESRLTHGYEFCFIFIKNNLKFRFNKNKKEFISDTFYCKIGNKGKTEHIAVYPKELPSFFIDLIASKDSIVLDPFIGSGTTAVACKQLGRKFMGFEINPEYVKIANKRLAQEVLNQKTKKTNENLHTN
jgi:DNA modification methylase